jgi:hypothetical protein
MLSLQPARPPPMAVQVLYKRGQPWSSLHLARPSVLGDGLLERARSTSFALLGLTAAVGLGLVALAVNQSWPLIPGGPIPVPPVERAAVHTATVAARPTAASGGLAAPSTAALRGPAGTRHLPPRRGGKAAHGDSQGTGPAHVVAPAPAPASNGGGQPAGHAAQPGAAEPPPAPSPAPLAESPKPAPESASASHPGNGKGKAKGVGRGRSGSAGKSAVPAAAGAGEQLPASGQSSEQGNGGGNGNANGGNGNGHAYGHGEGRGRGRSGG